MYTTGQLSNLAQAVGGTVSAEAFIGVLLWRLLGGNAADTMSNVVTDTGKCTPAFLSRRYQ